MQHLSQLHASVALHLQLGSILVFEAQADMAEQSLYKYVFSQMGLEACLQKLFSGDALQPIGAVA